MMGRSTGSVVDRSEGPTTGIGARPAQPTCATRLTSRDIEAEALARLARKGYDWTGTLRGRRGRNEPDAAERPMSRAAR